MSNILKKRREELGKDIDEIAGVTRIKKSYLRAIEEGDFEKLPVEVYTKGYIREYAEFLAIPMEQAFEPYERYLEDRKGVKGAEKKRAEAPPEEEKPEVFSAPSLPLGTGQGGETRSASSASRKIIRTVLILLIAGLAGFYFFGSGTKEAPLPPLPQVEPVPPPTVPPGDAGDKALQEPPAAPSALPEIPAAEAPRPAEAHSLNIAARERTWLQITIDGSGKREIILNSGEKVTYRVNENASVLIGNAAGVRMQFDGRPYENLGGKGEVVRMNFPGAVSLPVSPARKSAPETPLSQPATPESLRP